MASAQTGSHPRARPEGARCLGAGCLLLALSIGCDRPAAAPQQVAGATQVATVEVKRQDLDRSIEMPGTIEGFETADLYCRVSGYLAEVAVDIGDRVEKGQLLARLSVPEMKNEVDRKQAVVASAKAKVRQAKAGIRQAEADVKRAEAEVDEARTLLIEKRSQSKFRQAEFDRIEHLVNSGSLLAQRLDESRYLLEAAEAAMQSASAHVQTAAAALESTHASLEKAETDLASAEAMVAVAVADAEQSTTMMQYATIQAPFAGVILKRMVDPGAFVQSAAGNSAARPLLTITRTDVVRVMLDLPMKEVQWLDRDDPALLDRIDVLPGQQFRGRVARFSPSLDRTSRMMRVEIDLENPGDRLRPGYYGYVTLRLDEMPQTPVIPSSALLSEAGATFVYVVQDGVCRRQVVKTNFRDGSTVGIASGLRGGEQVVQAGGGQLSDGQTVEAVPAAGQNG